MTKISAGMNSEPDKLAVVIDEIDCEKIDLGFDIQPVTRINPVLANFMGCEFRKREVKFYISVLCQIVALIVAYMLGVLKHIEFGVLVSPALAFVMTWIGEDC